MKKIFALLAVLGILTFGVSKVINAQDVEAEGAADAAAVEQADTMEVPQQPTAAEEEVAPPKQPLYQQIKQKFIEGGAGFMGFILLTFIFGLALAIERIIYLNLATTNTNKLLDSIEDDMPMTILYNSLASYGVSKKVEWMPYPLFYMDFRPDILKFKKHVVYPREC